MYIRALRVLFRVRQGLLVTEARSPCFARFLDSRLQPPLPYNGEDAPRRARRSTADKIHVAGSVFAGLTADGYKRTTKPRNPRSSDMMVGGSISFSAVAGFSLILCLGHID